MVPSPAGSSAPLPSARRSAGRGAGVGAARRRAPRPASLPPVPQPRRCHSRPASLHPSWAVHLPAAGLGDEPAAPWAGPGREGRRGAAPRSKFPAGSAPPSPPGGGNFSLGLPTSPRHPRPGRPPPAMRGPVPAGQRRSTPARGRVRGRARRGPPRGEGSSCPARRKSHPRVTAATKEK